MMKPGDIVQLSETARLRGIDALKPNRKGVVTRVAQAVWVRWEGNKTATSYHSDFITLVKN